MQAFDHKQVMDNKHGLENTQDRVTQVENIQEEHTRQLARHENGLQKLHKAIAAKPAGRTERCNAIEGVIPAPTDWMAD